MEEEEDEYEEEDELEEVNKRVNKRCDTIPGGRPGPGASESIFPLE